MEISGKVVAILEPQSFVSQKNGNTYVTNVFIIETQGQYPKKVAFKVMGEDKFKQMQIVVGGFYNVSFDVESREWQGKWFTECQAWRAVRMDGQQQAQQSAVPNAKPSEQAVTQQQNGSQGSDDLPF